MSIHGPLQWSIRPAGKADAAALALVAQATFLEAYAGLTSIEDMLAHAQRYNSRAGFEAALDGGAQVWIAEAAGTRAPLGFAMLTVPDFDLTQPGDVELKRIYVLDRCQGQGLAKALFDTVLDASKGAARMLLGVNRDNQRAQGFYRKQGFAIAGTRTFTVGATTYDDFIYAKPLEQA
ncbi:MAG: GNAT family N-acetyltransferase [Sphingomonadaceae bacterium]